MPDFSVKQSFPIAEVINAAQKKAALEQQATAEGNKQIIQGLQSIGQVGESLFEQKKNIAQALAAGHVLGVDADTSRSLGSAENVIKAATVNKNNVDMTMLMSLLHGGAAPGAMPASMPSAPPAANPIIPASNMTATPIASPAPSASVTPGTPSPVSAPVPIAAPPAVKINKATADMAMKMALANKTENVMQYTPGGGLVSVGTKQKGDQVITSQPKIDIGEKSDQFWQREWDKLLKESDPLNASSRTPLGLASRATFQANRALKTLSNPVVTNQEAGNAMADVAAIYQNGSPTQFGMSHQEYSTLYGKVQGIVQSISGKPQDALPDAIKNRLIGVLSDMKTTNSALLKQRLDMTERSKKSVISRFPDEWKEYRQTLDGDQGAYSGLAPAATASHPPGWDNSSEQRLQMLLEKKANGTLKS